MTNIKESRDEKNNIILVLSSISGHVMILDSFFNVVVSHLAHDSQTGEQNLLFGSLHKMCEIWSIAIDSVHELKWIATGGED